MAADPSCRNCGRLLRVAIDHSGPTWAHVRKNGTAVFNCENPSMPAPALDFEPRSELEREASLRRSTVADDRSEEVQPRSMSPDLRRRLIAAAERGLAFRREQIAAEGPPGVPLSSGFDYRPVEEWPELALSPEAVDHLNGVMDDVAECRRRATASVATYVVGGPAMPADQSEKVEDAIFDCLRNEAAWLDADAQERLGYLLTEAVTTALAEADRG